MSRVINKANVREALSRLDGRRRNPSVDEVCVYTDPNDPERHCIAGQILIDLGWSSKVPKVGDKNNIGTDIEDVVNTTFTRRQREMVTNEGLDLLMYAQQLADTIADPDRSSNVRTWKQVRTTLSQYHDFDHGKGLDK